MHLHEQTYDVGIQHIRIGKRLFKSDDFGLRKIGDNGRPKV